MDAEIGVEHHPGFTIPQVADWRGVAQLSSARFRPRGLNHERAQHTSNYEATRVRGVILDEGTRCSAAHVKTMAMALRGYLRFLATRGDCRPGLDHAVPPTPDWRLSALPRYLPPGDVDRLIASCDLARCHGIRDRAILLLLARLGLRAHDVWAMEIDDVDWATAMLRAGATLETIGAVLRHELPDTTAHYAKVDVTTLHLIAQPWPEGT